MKKSLSLILALALLIGMIPMTAFATEETAETEAIKATEVTKETEDMGATEETEATEPPPSSTYEGEDSASGYLSGGTCGAELLWTLDSEGTLTITGTGEMTSWADEYSVPWNAYRDQIKKVTISEGVTTIGDYAFKQCTSLEDVTIPASVVAVKGRAFYGCSSLGSIDFTDGITTIEDKAFKECSSLVSVVLPANLTILGHGAFSNCSNLGRVVIPASVTNIKDYAFYCCSKLSEVVFLGDAPSLKSSGFYAVKATAYYPCDNSTWTSSNMLNYGGTITWKTKHNYGTATAVTAPTCTEKGYTTYTCECGDSYVDDYVDAVGHSYVSGVCTTCGAHTPVWDTDGDGVLEFIAIGNSFTVDALTYAYEIAQNLGIEDIVIGQLTIGGSGLSDHAANATGDLAKYRYRCNVNGDLSDTTTHEYKISTALEERSWDYIILQQRYYYSGVESTYNEDLTNLVEYLKERSDAKLVWHMTWAIRQDVVDDMYDNDQMTMYNAIVSCVQNKIVTNSDFDRVIPSGTALQNSRTSLLGDTDTRDGYHMSHGYGRYLTGLMFIKTITGLSIDDITYAPSGVDAQKMAIAIESVNNAYSNPFAVTDSKYVHTHAYTATVTAPTCTEQGYTTYTCACGESYVDSYVDATGHTYENGICTSCGAEHPNLANFEGKVISILGDSISTFAGYIPVADGFNLEHMARYPQDNLLTDVNETWWMQIINQLDAKLGINDSWRSTEVYNYIDAEVNDTYDGTKACMASTTRIQNLGSNGTPDVILFYGGTNDITQRRTVGSFDPQTAPAEVDLTSVKWDTVADAYVAAIMRMQYYYPNAEIIAMLPTFTYKNTDDVIEEYNSVFVTICEHYGVTYVDLRDSGITTANLPDGTHPDAEGMDYITEAVLEALCSACDMEAGEHIVHSVTHELSGAESSLGYYKGVSDGKSFVTTITGENLTVTVTMGGKDITASVFFDGVVNIPAVTDDIVITAEGCAKSVYEDHLQPIPEENCCGTNLWTVLEPENLYYTASGWGINATGLAHSVTILINPGDRLWATSFQTSGTNGGTGNGIRITWFDETDVLKSMSPSETYAEFSVNGYLTAPEGAVAVNVVMWNGSDDNELYILNRDHCYENGICTGCGQEKPVTVTAYGNIQYSVDGRIVTVTHTAACVVGYWDETAEQYIAIAATANADGSYSFDAAGKESVVLLVIGDVNGDGQLTMADKTMLDDYLGGKSLTVLQQFAADVNGNGKINSADRILLARALMSVTSPIYKPFVW